MIMVRHIKKTWRQFLHQKVVSHTLDNQRNIWWDPTGRFLGPGRVRNGPIALLKLNVRWKNHWEQKVNVILKMINPYIESRNAREKMQWSSQNWSERLKLPTLHRYYWRYSRKELLIRKNLMREGGEGGGWPPEWPVWLSGLWTWPLLLIPPVPGVRKVGGAALAIMGLEWTGGRGTWNIW